MPVLKDTRHERFAQALAKGMTADEAYVSAGYKRNRGNAARLKASESIRARVAELTNKASEKASLSKAWIIERLMQNVDQALGRIPTKIKKIDKETGAAVEFEIIDIDRTAANKALELLGKTIEIGMFVERKEIGGPGDFAAMTADELRTIVARDMAALGLSLQVAEDQGRSRKAGSQLN